MSSFNGSAPDASVIRRLSWRNGLEERKARVYIACLSFGREASCLKVYVEGLTLCLDVVTLLDDPVCFLALHLRVHHGVRQHFSCAYIFSRSYVSTGLTVR